MATRLSAMMAATGMVGLGLCGIGGARAAVVIDWFQDPTGNADFRNGDEVPLFDDKTGNTAMTSSTGSLGKNDNSAANIDVVATGGSYTGGSGFANYKSTNSGNTPSTNTLTAFTFSPGPDPTPFNQFDGEYIRGQIDSENGAGTETVTVTVDYTDLATDTTGQQVHEFTDVVTSDIGRIGFDEDVTSDLYNVTSVTWSLGSGAAAWNQIKQIEFSVPASVPEPSTWALMVVGFLGLGYAAFRRTGKPRSANGVA
jgi:hypothetical protein